MHVSAIFNPKNYIIILFINDKIQKRSISNLMKVKKKIMKWNMRNLWVQSLGQTLHSVAFLAWKAINNRIPLLVAEYIELGLPIF